MKPGDLIRYRGLRHDDTYPHTAIGLCLRKEKDPYYPKKGMKMLVKWFDDGCCTYEDLDVCIKDDWVEIISESR